MSDYKSEQGKNPLEEFMKDIDTSEIRKHLQRTLSPRISASMAIYNHTMSFYGNAEEFMQSKRFIRFTGFVEDAVKNMMLEMGVSATDRNTGDTLYGKAISLKEAIESCVYQHTLVFSEQESLEHLVEREEAKSHTQNVSLCATLDIFPDRFHSNLWAVQEMIAEVNGGKYAVNEDGEPLVNDNVRAVLKDKDLFGKVYEDALFITCYDYIMRSAIDNDDLNENNWLTTLKNFTRSQIIYLATMVYKRTLQGVEDCAAFRLLCVEQDNSLLSKLNSAICMNEAEQNKQDLLKEVAGRLTELLAMKDRELEAQKQKNAELQKQINENREKDKRESEAQKELRKLQAKFEKLSARYESLLNYTTQLEAPDDDVVDEGVPLDEELLKKQRIVFVRDKKHEGYVIMQKLADYFPNARFTNCIASEINAKTTDLIVQMIPYVCHGTYWGAESVAERKNVPMLSIRNTNPDVMIAKINEAIQRKLAKQS